MPDRRRSVRGVFDFNSRIRLYSMRTDAVDRFGTQIEKHITPAQIYQGDGKCRPLSA